MYDTNQLFRDNKIRKGFTLIELLVVIAIIALLLSITIPSLRAAKEMASSIPCKSNMRSLATAAYMYQDENDGILVSSYTWYKPRTPHPKDPVLAYAHDAWVFSPLDDHGNVVPSASPSDFPIDIRYEKNGIKAGKLWPYIEDEEVYHCPADRRASRGYGFRTYSMTMTLRNCHGTPELVTNKLKYELHKMSEIRSPGDKIAYVESIWDPGYWNLGAFIFDIVNRHWLELPAAWHTDGVVLSYLDGHAEKYKWKDAETKAALDDPWSIQRWVDIKYSGISQDQEYFATRIPSKPWKK